MPFIPHTEEEIQSMLETIGASGIEDLFDEIPADLRHDALHGIPDGLNEMAVARVMKSRAQQDGEPLCFTGAGAYSHHIPAAVWELVTRGEFYSAYTPYQAEASQGTLQLVYEFQSMMTALTGMDVSNASMYDGGSAMAEAILMAVRGQRRNKDKRILVARSVHPNYRKVSHNIVKYQGITIEEVPFSMENGHIEQASLDALGDEPFTALVIQQPNFFGVLEDVDALTDWAHAKGALVIASVNPTSLGLLKPPGEWGEQGADIVVGEGQPMGVPLASGGPYFGFMCCTQKLVRQMPGRIVGKTEDMDGKVGYALTLQAREQHIRRSKATSNICTNQGLMVTAATIHMSLLGPQGLRNVAMACHNNLVSFSAQVCANDGVSQRFGRPVFHEQVIQLEGVSSEGVLKHMAANNIVGGYDLSAEYPELENCLLLCATEVHSDADFQQYNDTLQAVLASASANH